MASFNPWFIGRVGINYNHFVSPFTSPLCFNPWFIGRVGININLLLVVANAEEFQSLVYWKGGDKSPQIYGRTLIRHSFNPWFIGRVGINYENAIHL